MSEISDPLANIQTRRHLEEVKVHVLPGDGETIELPGKYSEEHHP